MVPYPLAITGFRNREKKVSGGGTGCSQECDE